MQAHEALESIVIVRVDHQAQARQHILHLGPRQRALRPAVHRHPRSPQRTPELRCHPVDAREHSDIPVPLGLGERFDRRHDASHLRLDSRVLTLAHTVVGLALDHARQLLDLLLLPLRHEHREGVVLGASKACMQLLDLLFTVCRDQRFGRLEHVEGAAVALVQHHGQQLGVESIHKLDEVVGRGAAEGVDDLVVVAHHRHTTVPAAVQECLEQVELGVARVLKLVHKHIPDPLAHPPPHPLAPLQRPRGLPHQRVEVERAPRLQRVLHRTRHEGEHAVGGGAVGASGAQLAQQRHHRRHIALQLVAVRATKRAAWSGGGRGRGSSSSGSSGSSGWVGRERPCTRRCKPIRRLPPPAPTCRRLLVHWTAVLPRRQHGVVHAR
mmetsp:Transcript_2845/g.8642  ORF Transcript_2845/g.8642 Transcript_2845/m.8642 type:complete len:382 (-) Transcript_2845:1027-2172(-)